jgi:histone-lysine N-methyltransferase SETMAR
MATCCNATWDTLRPVGRGVLDHPPYSPDLSPCDYHVFGPLKKTLKKGRQFKSDEAVREAVEQWFIQQPVFFAEGITKLVQRRDKCQNSAGQYL